MIYTTLKQCVSVNNKILKLVNIAFKYYESQPCFILQSVFCCDHAHRTCFQAKFCQFCFLQTTETGSLRLSVWLVR